MGFFSSLFGGLSQVATASAPIATSINPAVGAGLAAGGSLGTALTRDSSGNIAGLPAQGAMGGSGGAGHMGSPGNVMRPQTLEDLGQLAMGTQGKVAGGTRLVQMSTVANGLATLTNVYGIYPSPGERHKTVTVVFSFNATGQIRVKDVEVGRPMVMSKDAQKVRRVKKVVNSLKRKIAPTAPKPSKTKQLTDAVVDRALDNVQCSVVAPPQLTIGKHCHGH